MSDPKTGRKPILGKISCPICEKLYAGLLMQCRDKGNSIYFRCSDCRAIIFGESGILNYIRNNRLYLKPLDWNQKVWNEMLE